MTGSTHPWLRGLLTAVLIAVLSLLAPADAAAQDENEAEAQSEAQSEAEAEQAAEPRDDGPNIYPTLAAGLVERGVPVIDVRTAEEIAETGRIGNAVHIPHTEIDRMVEFIGEDKTRTVVLYCRSGRRAAMAVEALRERGYHGLVNAGGFEDLAEAINQ